VAYFVDRVIIEPFERLFERLADYLPNILTSVLIFVTGVLLGLIVKHIALRFLKALKIDKVTERSGAIGVMRKGGVREPLSALLATGMGATKA
jgi:hypothetical protein